MYIDTPESLKSAEEKAAITAERELELAFLRKEADSNNNTGTLGLLGNAPFSVHVAISASIIIASVWIIKKLF
jgi:hypothetical protein